MRSAMNPAARTARAGEVAPRGVGLPELQQALYDALRDALADERDAKCDVARQEVTGYLTTEVIPPMRARYPIAGLNYTVDGAFFGQSDEVAGANVINVASLYNPAGSGALLVLYAARLDVYPTALGGTPFFELSKIVVAPTGGTAPNLVRRANNETAGRGVFRYGPMTATAGTDRMMGGFTPGAATGRTLERRPPMTPIVLDEGCGALWHTQDDATNVRLAAAFEWFEVSA